MCGKVWNCGEMKAVECSRWGVPHYLNPVQTFHVSLHVKHVISLASSLSLTCRFAVAFTDALKEQAQVLLVRNVEFTAPGS